MSFLDDPRQMAADVKALLDAIADIERATTPEEKAAAQLRADTEAALQWAAISERNRQRLRDHLKTSWNI